MFTCHYRPLSSFRVSEVMSSFIIRASLLSDRRRIIADNTLSLPDNKSNSNIIFDVLNLIAQE